LIGGESGKMIIRRPTRELTPFDRLELAACELKRTFGCRGAGSEMQGRANEDRADKDRADLACDHTALRGERQPSIGPHASKCMKGGIGPRCARYNARPSNTVCLQQAADIAGAGFKPVSSPPLQVSRFVRQEKRGCPLPPARKPDVAFPWSRAG